MHTTNEPSEPQPHQEPTSETMQAASLAREALDSRNWELELLISGAVFFSLFQLPGLIQNALENSILQSSSVGITVGLLYAKAVSYLLIFNLGGHFLLRGYWVGLLGLASVFPKEIIWENLPYPPLFKDFYRTKIRTLTATAQTVDDICRMIFGFTFLILLMMLGISFLYGVTGLIILFIGALFPQFSTVVLSVIVFSVMFIPIFFVATMNSVLNRKPEMDSPRLRRWLFPMLNFSQILTLGRFHSSLMFTLRSNVARGKIIGVLTVFFMFINLAPLAELLLGYSRHIFFSKEDSPASMEAAFYENFRQQEGNTIDRTLFRYPSIQADVINDAYIRLFLPYRAKENDSIQARMGADFRGFHREGLFIPMTTKETDSTRERALKGLASIYSVSINDSLYSSLDYFFHRHPQTSVPGLLTYIPTTGLRQGKNLLVVRKFGKTTEYFIPFYFVPR